MFHVYILQSMVDQRYYVGTTSQSVEQRLREHNESRAFHTRKFIPWKIVWFCSFREQKKAMAFEKYLKTGSGYAFSRKRLI